MTDFFNDDGTLSSSRLGFDDFSLTDYAESIGDSIGGVTDQIGNMSTRFSNSGDYLGSSVQLGGNTTYFGKDGGVSAQMTSFC